MAEQRLQVVLRLNFPYGEIGRETGAILGLVDRDGVLDDVPVKLGWEYADDKVNDLQERDRDVDRAVARIFAARARQEAVARNRAGDYRGARQALSGVARRIRDYAGRDHELREIVGRARARDRRHGRPDGRAGPEAGPLPGLHARPDADLRRPRDARPGRGRPLSPGASQGSRPGSRGSPGQLVRRPGSARPGPLAGLVPDAGGH